MKPIPNSRRRFLAAAALTAGAAITLRPRSVWALADATSLDPRVPQLVASTIGIDTHNHIDVPLTAADMPGPNIDLAGQMRRSGLSAICMTFATDYAPGDAYDRFLHALASMDRQLALNRMQRSLTSAAIRSAHNNSQPTVIQAVEGAHFLQGHIDRVEIAYNRGLRHFGLLHDSDASVPLGDVYTNPPRFGGLTPFGATVVKECNRLGILIDLAHADLKTTQDALRLSTRPVVISHTGPDWRLGTNPDMARMMRPRLISKDHALAVANAGGLVGVWIHLTDTPLDYAHNLRALADVIGIDHVCIGTDTKLTTPSPRPPGPTPNFPPPNFPHPQTPPPASPNHASPQHSHAGERTNQAWEGETAGFYFTVVDAMLKSGFTPNDIAKIGGQNYLRVFAQATRA